MTSVEEEDKFGIPKGTLGAIECSSNSFGETFWVGTGFSAAQRLAMWEDRDALVGNYCHVKYQHITPGRGVPRFPVFFEIISAEDIP